MWPWPFEQPPGMGALPPRMRIPCKTLQAAEMSHLPDPSSQEEPPTIHPGILASTLFLGPQPGVVLTNMSQEPDFRDPFLMPSRLLLKAQIDAGYSKFLFQGSHGCVLRADESCHVALCETLNGSSANQVAERSHLISLLEAE